MKLLKNIPPIAVVAIILIIVSLAVTIGPIGPQTTISTQTLSVSSTTLNGQPAILVVQNAGLPNQVILAELNSQVSGFNSPKKFEIHTSATNNVYQFTATDRADVTGTINSFSLYKSCSDILGCRTVTGDLLNPDPNKFVNICTTDNQNNIVLLGGDVITPKWYCYRIKPTWKLSDFNMVSGVYAPKIDVTITQYPDSANLIIGQGWSQPPVAQGEVLLTNSNQLGDISLNGVNLGNARISNIVSTFVSPPSSSGIKAIRPFGSSSGYIIVPGYITDTYSTTATNLQSCLRQSANPSAGSLTIQLLGLFGINYNANVNAGSAISCIDTYNSAISSFQSYNSQLSGTSFAGISSVEQIGTSRIASLPDNFGIPQVLLTLYADKVGIIQPIAVPASVSCQAVQLSGGQTLGSFPATIKNGQTAGTLVISASCPAPFTVRPESLGSYSFSAGETKQIQILVSTSSSSGSGVCTVSASDQNGANKITSQGCTISQTPACNNVVPPVGFLLDANCVPYCPLTIASCPSPNVLKTPATGYPDKCVCDSSVALTCNDGTSVGQCNSAKTKRCNIVLSVPTLQDDVTCGTAPPGGQNTTIPVCIPIVQQLVGVTAGGIQIPIIGNVGGYTAYTCQTDYLSLGVIIVAIVIIVYFATQRRRK